MARVTAGLFRECSERLLGSLAVLVVCSSALTAQEFKQIYPSNPIPHVYSLVQWKGDTIYACGPNSLFMRSTDAGLTWREVFTHDTHYDFPRMGANSSGIYLLPAASSLTKSEFMDSTSTFLLHYDPATGDTNRIQVPVPCKKTYADYLPREISVTYNALFMLQNSRSLYADTKMALVRSTDNGVTWQQIPMPDSTMVYAATIHFRDADNGVLTAPRPDSVKTQAIYITSNAGTTWQRVYGFHHPRQPLETAIQWVTDSVIVILGDDGLLHVTEDHGAHWVTSAATNFTISTFQFLPDGTGYVIGGGDGQVAKSTDFGAVWIDVKSGRFPSSACATSVLTLRPSVFTSFNRNGTYFVTRDGGITWDISDTYEYSLPSFWFFSRYEGFVYVTSSLWTLNPWNEFYGTTDGGESWNLLFKDDKINYATIHPATSTDIWAVQSWSNPDTLIYHSTNKGLSWEVSYINKTGDTLKADFYTYGNFSVGRDSLCVLTNAGILRTIDRGKSWSLHSQILPYLSNLKVNDFKFLYACFNRHIWLCTPNKILRSDDYGQTWKPTFELDTSVYHKWESFRPVGDSIVLVSLLRYVSSSLKASYTRTTNAGNTWQTYTNDVKFLPDGRGLSLPMFSDGTSYSTSLSYFNRSIKNAFIQHKTSSSIDEYII